jgi:hypothetical protein
MFFSVYLWWLKRIFASELSWAAVDGDLDESVDSSVVRSLHFAAKSQAASA